MSEHAKLRQDAFVAGAKWSRGFLTPDALTEAQKRYPEPIIESAPSGRWYRVIGEWNELRGYKTYDDAIRGESVGSYCGIMPTDVAACARLLNRVASA